MADPNAVARQFAEFYYTTFSSDRPGLQTLYVSDNGILMRLEMGSDIDLVILAGYFDAYL
jgi:hypothetical protein